MGRLATIAWPSIRIDETLTKDYDETLDFMAKLGLNELSLWGFYTARDWEPAVEQTITPERKALVEAWIEKAHRRGMDFSKEADLPAIRQMTRQVDYLIDVGETAVNGGVVIGTGLGLSHWGRLSFRDIFRGAHVPH